MLGSGIISCIYNWTFIMGAYGEELNHDPSVMVYIELNHAPIPHPGSGKCQI